jgi:hypothetical protein
MSVTPRLPKLTWPLLALLTVALVLPGCKQEETRPTYESQVSSRAKAVQQAERKRQEAQQQEQAAQNAAGASGDQSAAGGAATSGAQGTPAAAPGYLPPSEQGADVEITESPVDGAQAPTRSNQTAAAPPAPAAAAPAGAGGNMPSGVNSAPSSGASPTPAAGATGATGSASPRAAPGVDALTTPTATAAARTSAEQSAALNQELQRKLAEFDALMRKAQENAQRERAMSGGSPQGEDGGRGARLEAPPEGEQGAGGAANRASGLGQTPDQSGDIRAAAGTRSRGGAELRLPDGSGDDVVARQLREAAERESDPVLREKLWDEYRKYKGISK